MLRFIAGTAPLLKRLAPRLVADPRRVGGSVFRIHRDTRFSKDEAPYKTNAEASFRDAAGAPHEPTGALPLARAR